MTVALIALYYRFKNWIIGAGAVLLVILGVYTKGRSDGKDKAVEDDRKDLQKDVQLKKKINNDASNDSDSDLDKRLRNWVKD